MIVMVAEAAEAIEVVSAAAEVVVSVAIVRRSVEVVAVAAIVVVATVVHNGQQKY